MVLVCVCVCLWFSRGYSLVFLREVGFALSLYRCVVVVGVWVG